MFKFLKKSFSSVAFSLLAVSVLLAPAKTNCMEGDINLGNDLVGPGWYGDAKNLATGCLGFGKLFFQSFSPNYGLQGANPVVPNAPIELFPGVDAATQALRNAGSSAASAPGNMMNAAIDALTNVHPNIKKLLAATGISGASLLSLRGAYAAFELIMPSAIKDVMYYSTMAFAIYVVYRGTKFGWDRFEYMFDGFFNLLNKGILGVGKYTGLGIFKGVKLTGSGLINGSGSLVSYLFKKDPVLFQTIMKDRSLLSKIGQVMFGKDNPSSVILNSDCAGTLGGFVLLDKIITDAVVSGENNIDYKNILLTGNETFVKKEFAKEAARISGKNLIIIDEKSLLFVESNFDANKSELVSNFFNKLTSSKTASLIFVDMESINSMLKTKSDKQSIVNEILDYSKQRSNKYNFVFGSLILDEQLKQALSASYDEVVGISSPDKHAREQIISHLVDKLILDKSQISTLQKLGITSGSITVEKQQAFKEYFTQEKLNWVIESLDGKSYQEVQNFVKQLRAFMGQKTVGAIKNYDVFINILLNRASSVFSGKDANLDLNPEKYLEAACA